MRWALSILMLWAYAVLLAMPAAAQDNGACAGTLPRRLMPGLEARVSFTDGRPLNVRAGVYRTARVVTTLPEGAAFDVTGWPVCTEGIFWYPVKTGEFTGWIAEAVDGEYLAETAADVRLEDVLPEDAVIVARVNSAAGGRYAFLDRSLSALRIIDGPVQGYVLKNGLFNFMSVADGSYFVTAQNVGGEVARFAYPGSNGTFSGFRVSPDGSRVAWLFDTTPVLPTFDGCEVEDGCIGRRYQIDITGADGTNATLTEFLIGHPYPRAALQDWVDGRIVLDHAMFGVASYYFPISGGGLTAVDDRTGAQTELTALTDTDEVISPDGTRIAARADSDTLVSIDNLVTGERWSLPRSGNFSGAYTFSPGGRYLAYTVVEYDGSLTSAALWVYDSETDETRPLIALPAVPDPLLLTVNAWLGDDLAVLSAAPLDSENPDDRIYAVVRMSTGETVSYGSVAGVPASGETRIGQFIGLLNG